MSLRGARPSGAVPDERGESRAGATRSRTSMRDAMAAVEAASKYAQEQADVQIVPGVEFEYSDADFERIRALIYRQAGIKLCPSKRTMAYGRLVRRLRALGMRRFKDYLDLVESANGAEREAFTNALTTNLTAFFREAHHFPILEEHLAPRMRRSTLTIWCAGCSTGEEAYSIAIAVAMAFGREASRVHILATDVDTNVLATAERGVYPSERVEKLPADYVQRFFLEGVGRNAGYIKVREEAKKQIVFRQLNLLDPSWPIRAPIQAIFCRNVMIYFDKDTQRNILGRFASLLEPGGLLFAGHSENFTQAGDLFRSLGRTVYARVDAGAAAGTNQADSPRSTNG